MIRRQQTVALNFFFYRKLKIMNEYNELLFSLKKTENFQFCTKMYMGSTRNGIEFCFNSQTVFNAMLLLKAILGLNCCHLTKNCGGLKSH